jgi:type I restriction enzyme S subunit
MWKTVKLEDVCTKITDGSHFSPKTLDDGIPYITVRDVNETGINFDNCKYVNEDSYKELYKNGCAPSYGDVLFSKDGTVGKVAIVDTDIPFVVLSSLAILTPNQSVLSTAYLSYVLKSPKFLAEAIGKKTGVAIRRIILKNLKQIQFLLPPLAEQQRIVAKLDASFSEIDRAIEVVERNAENAEAFFTSYLTSEFEVLKKSHTAVPIADACAEIFAGGDAPKENFSDTKTEKYSIPIFANAAKRKGLYGYTDKARVLNPSITVAGRGSGTGYTEIRHEPFLPIVRLIVLTPNTEVVSLEYFKHAILSLDVLSSGSAIPQLTVPMMKGYEIPTPKLAEQIDISKRLEHMESTTQTISALYKTKLNKLYALKSSLLATELIQQSVAA